MFHPEYLSLEVTQDGRVLRAFRHDNQLFLEAPPSGKYELRLRNLTPERILAVPSIDGLNILDGEPASFNGAGYVLSAYEPLTINGWHRTSEKTAAFVFSSAVGGSYTDQMGHGTSNVGVLGVAVFRERPAPVLREPQWSRHPVQDDFALRGSPRGCISDASPIGTLSSTPTKACAMPQDLGTGYGEELAMRTQTTTFSRRTPHPEQVVQVRYASRAVLLSWGVPVDQPTAPPAPRAFPQEVGVKAPPGWRG